MCRHASPSVFATDVFCKTNCKARHFAGTIVTSVTTWWCGSSSASCQLLAGVAMIILLQDALPALAVVFRIFLGSNNSIMELGWTLIDGEEQT